MTERVIDNRGSKSTIVRTLRDISVLILSVVKEQRVYGSWQEKYTLLLSRCSHSCLRYILMDFERNYQIKILSKLSSINKMYIEIQGNYSFNIISLYEQQSFILKFNLKLRRYRSYTTIKIVVPRSDLDIYKLDPNAECRGFVDGILSKTPKFISYKLLTTRFYSAASKKSCSTTEYRDLQLDPWWVTGFVDGGGSFHVLITQRNDLKQGWEIRQGISIVLHVKDKAVLILLKQYLGVGKISSHGSKSIQWRVFSAKDLKTIKNHFARFPLKTKKWEDCELWMRTNEIIERREHLTLEGLRQIVAIRASMNQGLSEKLKSAYPYVVPVVRPVVSNPTTIDPNWLAGFTSAEGCFFINISASQTHSVGFKLQLIFVLTQDSRDVILLLAIIEFLKCGNIYRKGDVYDLRVSKFGDIISKIIPFFKNIKLLELKLVILRIDVKPLSWWNKKNILP